MTYHLTDLKEAKKELDKYRPFGAITPIETIPNPKIKGQGQRCNFILHDQTGKSLFTILEDVSGKSEDERLINNLHEYVLRDKRFSSLNNKLTIPIVRQIIISALIFFAGYMIGKIT